MKSLKTALIILFFVFCSVNGSYNIVNADDCNKNEQAANKSDLYTISELTFEHVNREEMSYIIVAPKNINTENENPLIVYLHEFGGTGENLNLLDSRLVLIKILKRRNSNLEKTFNGYILFPQTPDPNWIDKGEQVMDIIEEFAMTHKIDKDNIALVGCSMGAEGAGVIATTTKDDGSAFFSRVLVLSGVPPSRALVRKFKKLRIPVYGVEALNESQTGKFIKALSKTNDVLYTQAGNKHNEVGLSFFKFYAKDSDSDSDDNNQTDFIEWLFPDYKH